MTTTQQIETYTVIAEDAPTGVQLWPTASPDYALNFTLESVAVIRTSSGRRFVTWTYQNGNQRHFDLGEEVTCGKV